MTCAACQAHVEKAVNKVDGVQVCTVNLLTNSMVVEFDAAVTAPETIISAVEHAGYGANIPGTAAASTPTGGTGDGSNEEADA